MKKPSAPPTDYFLPPVISIQDKIQDNPIQQLLNSSVKATDTGRAYNSNGVTGTIVTLPDKSEALIVRSFEKMSQLKALTEPKILTTSNEGRLFWYRHPATTALPAKDSARIKYVSKITDTWKDSFQFLKEIKDKATDEITQFGLRQPQVGAIHAIVRFPK